MEIKPVRKGSLMIKGTYRNADHHAKPCLPMIEFLETAFKTVLIDDIKVWRQGHNVHFLESKHHDRVLMFRPFHREDEWGIEVSLSVSRSVSFPLFNITDVVELPDAIIFISFFLTAEENMYQRMTEGNKNKPEDE